MTDMRFLEDDDTQGNPPYPADQSGRREKLMDDMLARAESVERAAGLVMAIIEESKGRMKLDEKGQLVVVGKLALYRVNINAFLAKFINPFTYNSFDVVEVHPKSGLVPKPETACVQVRHQEDMPAYDLLASYLLGLLSDDVTWLEESLQPLRRTLFQIYGYSQSPLTPSLAAYFARTINGEFDYSNDTFTFEGTNGWKWRLTFGQPLTRGLKIEYQKPRQSWWNHMFDDHLDETTGHYNMCGFFDTVEHLAQCPGMLKTAGDWEVDPIFLRTVAKDYPPLARAMVDTLIDENYDPAQIYTYYDEQVSEEEAERINWLDIEVLERAVV